MRGCRGRLWDGTYTKPQILTVGDGVYDIPSHKAALPLFFQPSFFPVRSPESRVFAKTLLSGECALKKTPLKLRNGPS